jgi:hypothetical protein
MHYLKLPTNRTGPKNFKIRSMKSSGLKARESYEFLGTNIRKYLNSTLSFLDVSKIVMK